MICAPLRAVSYTHLFTVGEDLDCYVSEDDLLAKTEYYLSHEKERAEIAQNGLLTVQKKHNYPERLLTKMCIRDR